VFYVPHYRIEHALWRDLSTDQFFEIVQLRYAVYALEQRVDAEDFDEADRAPSTQHWWIRDDATRLSAYLRLLAPPRNESHPLGSKPASWAVGRMVVRSDMRRQGLAQRLLQAALDAHPGEAFVLHAQSYTQSLYTKLGFVAFGDEFDEAGIPHVRMYRAGAP